MARMDKEKDESAAPTAPQEIVVKLAPETIEDIKEMLEGVLLRPVRVRVSDGLALPLNDRSANR
jgi:hypothetical protein